MAATKPRLSLKYKILFLLTSVPTITLLIYIYFVTDIFKKDKITYVYDATLAISKTNAAQVRGRFETLLAQLIPITMGYRPEENYFANISQDVFKKNEAVTRILVYELTPGTHPTITVKADLKKRLKENEVPMDLIKKAENETSRGSIFIEISAEDPSRGWLGFQTADQGKNRLLMLADIGLPNLKDLFGGPSLFDNMILSSGGRIIAGSKTRSGMITDIFQNTAALGAYRTVNESAGGAELVSKNGEPYIGTFSGIGIGGLTSLSVIKTSDAMLTLVYLYRKSIVFFIAMIAGGLLLSIWAAAKLTRTLRKLYMAARKIGEGDFTVRVTEQSNDEIGVLSSTFNEMAEHISNLINEKIQKARMEKELEAGRTVQNTLFPPASAKLAALEVHGFYQPATECGGDWWSYYECEDKTLVLIGDATGHGVPAALVTSAACATVAVFKNLKETNPARLMGLLNYSIFQSTKGEIQMTFFLGVYDQKTRKLDYCNASHPPPLLCTAGAQNDSAYAITHLNASLNPRLGEKAQWEFQSASIQVSKKDLLVCFTDGVTDLTDPSGRPLGYKKFYKNLVASLAKPTQPESVKETLLADLWKYRNQAELPDDVTFFIAELF